MSKFPTFKQFYLSEFLAPLGAAGIQPGQGAILTLGKSKKKNNKKRLKQAKKVMNPRN